MPNAAVAPSTTSRFSARAVPKSRLAERSATTQVSSSRSASVVRTCVGSDRAVRFQSMSRASSPGSYGAGAGPLAARPDARASGGRRDALPSSRRSDLELEAAQHRRPRGDLGDRGRARPLGLGHPAACGGIGANPTVCGARDLVLLGRDARRRDVAEHARAPRRRACTPSASAS